MAKGIWLALAVLIGTSCRAEEDGLLDLQKRIDEIAAQGGGTLALTSGVYKTGALFFRPGVNLHLEKGARIQGVDGEEGYPQRETRIEGQTCVYYPALINADSCDGFRITGEGVIDGNGLPTWKEFWSLRKRKPDCTNKELMRPRLLYVSNSKNVDVSGVTFKNAKFWTTHYYRCENVVVHDCAIVAEVIDGVRGPSTDAIDIDACRNFAVRNVVMDVNDDAVVIKGGKGPWADDPVRCPGNGPTENVRIENCLFRETCHSCLTLGSECVGVTNVVMRGCKIEGAGNLLNIKMRYDTPQRYAAITVENNSGSCRTFFNAKKWMQFTDMDGRTDVPVSSLTGLVMRGNKISCDRQFVYEPEEWMRFIDCRFENNEITAKIIGRQPCAN